MNPVRGGLRRMGRSRTRALIAAVATVAVGASVPTLSGQERFWRGDANQDGALDVSDAVATFAFLFTGGARPACDDAVDTNDDGRLDLSDGIYTLGWLFQGGPAPPPPAFDLACPGTDPTEDGLGCADGYGSSGLRPAASLVLVAAPPPGVRVRSRDRLPHVSCPRP